MSLAYILLFLNKRPVASLFCVLFQSLILMTVMGLVEPMISKSKNRMQLINEFFVLTFAYFLLPLTEFTADLTTRDYVGKILIAICLFNLGVNILFSFS